MRRIFSVLNLIEKVLSSESRNPPAVIGGVDVALAVDS
jgi:hypothetical protein